MAEARQSPTHLGGVFCLLARVIDKLGDDALTGAQGGAEGDGLLWPRWHGSQDQVVLERAQLAAVQGQAPGGFARPHRLKLKHKDPLREGRGSH